MSQIEPGFNLGQYRIVEQIGKGGMATVYKAYQEKLDRYVAIKVLPDFYAEDATFVKRFEQEAQLIARLRHPNILTVFDFGQQENVIYIVSEYVAGGTLKDKMGAPLPYEYVNSMAAQVASALDYAHSQGILHRDIKPSNILLTTDGIPVLSDFGLARILEGSERLTLTAVALGTPEYMAPEQAMGQEADRRADIYSFGIVLYEMLAGTVPYAGDTPVSVILGHIQEPLPSPRTKNPGLSEAVEMLLTKALAKKPEDRFQTAGELAEAAQGATQVKVGDSLLASATPLAPLVKTGAAPRIPETGVTQPVLQPGGSTRPPHRLWPYGAAVVIVLAILGVVGTRFLQGPAMSGAASTPQTTGVPTVSGAASAPQTTGVPTAPGAASAPQALSTPTVSGAASAPQTTGVPPAPGVASAPQTVSTPAVAGAGGASQTGNTPTVPGVGSSPQTGNTPVPSSTSAASQTGSIKAKIVLANGSPVSDLYVDVFTIDAYRRGLNPLATKRTDGNGIVIFEVNPGDYVVGWSRATWPPELPFPAETNPVRVVSGKMVEKVIELQIGLGSAGQGGSLGLGDILQSLK